MVCHCSVPDGFPQLDRDLAALAVEDAEKEGALR